MGGLQGLHDAAADRVVPDQCERAHRDGAAEFVAHHGQHARDRLAPGRPGRGVGGVGVDHSPHLRHVPVHVGVRGGVRGRHQFRVFPRGRGAVGIGGNSRHRGAVEVRDHHELRGQIVVGDPRGFDDHEVVAGDPRGDVSGGPDHQLVSRQFGVQPAHFAADPGNRVRQRAHAGTPAVRSGLVAFRWIALSRCMTSLAPLPK